MQSDILVTLMHTGHAHLGLSLPFLSEHFWTRCRLTTDWISMLYEKIMNYGENKFKGHSGAVWFLDLRSFSLRELWCIGVRSVCYIAGICQKRSDHEVEGGVVWPVWIRVTRISDRMWHCGVRAKSKHFWRIIESRIGMQLSLHFEIINPINISFKD